MLHLSTPKLRELAQKYQNLWPEGHQNWYRARQLATGPLGNIRLGKLTVTHLSRYRDQRINQDGMSAQTLHHEINMLRTIIRVARVEWGMVHVPDHHETFSLLKMPAISGHRDRRLQEGEWEALWSCSDTTMQLAMVIAVETAVRRSELCALKWEHVDLQNRILKLPKEITKTKKERKVPLTKTVTHELKMTQRQRGLILGMTANGLGCRWKRIRPAAAKKCPSVASWRWHDFRHECISRLAERGWSVPELQVVSGHTTWRELQKYVNLKASDLIDRMDEE
jgi:integrase